MAASHGLQVAMEHATRLRDAAVQRLAQARLARQRAQQQMDQLTGYSGETEQRWLIRGQLGIAPEVMFHHRQFMSRLDQTIELQKTQMARHDQLVQDAERELTQAELRLVSLRQVVQRRQHDAALALQRREQKEVDELAASRHRLKIQPTA